MLYGFLCLRLTSLVLELDEGLDKHTVSVEHQRAIVGMLLDFSVVVQTGSAFALERRNLELWFVHRYVSTGWMEAILLHFLLIVLQLLIILV